MSDLTNNNVQCFDSLDKAMQMAHADAHKNAKEAGSGTGESSTKVGNYTITAKTELHGGLLGKLGMVKGTSFEIKKMSGPNAGSIAKGVFNKGKYQKLGQNDKIDYKMKRKKDQNIASQITTISKEIETIKGHADNLNKLLSAEEFNTAKFTDTFGKMKKEQLLEILNFGGNDSLTPLFFAVCAGNGVAFMDALKSNNFEITKGDLMPILGAENNDGRTPLHVLLNNPRLDKQAAANFIGALKEAGIDGNDLVKLLKIPDKSNRMPLDYAVWNQNQKFLDALIKKFPEPKEEIQGLINEAKANFSPNVPQQQFPNPGSNQPDPSPNPPPQ
jgi:hypothetical protein